jgi:bifunctional UDP-N-acetylglucosamine pyrophosphorylase / glucosamine-1-phosphate N-acetyltransferase
VQAVTTDLPAETAGVNDRVQLASAGRMLNARLVEKAMRAGVTVVDPDTTWIGFDVQLEPDVTLLPNTMLIGRTRIAAGATVGPDCSLTDTEVGEGAEVRRTTADSAVIGAGATVGPYTYLRPGTRLGGKSKAGAFVEMKAANVGDGAKVPHLTYVGDADIGEGSNIGCATVFVNYDGVQKHRTTVGRHTRIGSDTMLVAPVTIGDGAYTAAGSVITSDVPPGAIGVARAKQRNVEGWVARRRPGSTSDEAARTMNADSAGSPDPAEPARTDADLAQGASRVAGESQ